MRRDPELKWKYTKERLEEKLIVQQLLLKEAIDFIKPKKGKIVYATCSLLPEENLMQVIKFCEEHGFEIEGGCHFSTLPTRRGMDGFFSATLTERKE